MAKILTHPRIYAFLHVPVQSGSDSVLMDMKREYCQADFRQVVDFLKQRSHSMSSTKFLLKNGKPGIFKIPKRFVVKVRKHSKYLNAFM